MNWPPVTRAEFLELQEKYGGDLLIAKGVGVTKRRVETRRRLLEVEPVLTKTQYQCQPKGPLPEKEIARLFAGRRF